VGAPTIPSGIALTFLLCAVLIGGNLVSIRFSNRELDPLWGAGLRIALAALIFAGIMVFRRLRFPTGRALFGALIIGVLDFAGGFALLYYALVSLPAGLAATLGAVLPLETLLLAVLWRQERLTGAAILGGLLAVAGVAAMSGVSVNGEIPLLSILAALAGSLCIAQGTVLVRLFPDVHPVTLNAVGTAIGAALLIGLSLLAGEDHQLPAEPATWIALAYAVLIGSVVVFLLAVHLIRTWGASRSSYLFVVSPLFAIGLSVWLDDEVLGWELVAGGALVVLGVYVGALRSPVGRTDPAPAIDG
jgi:drug/metabolite transporter (DMT)-like permease